LIITLRGWFQMLTAAGDETKYKKWFTVLKQAALWLVVIWLAWLFVSLIFYIINKNSTTSA
jgi:type II secretory pathway component PulL